MLTLLFVNNHSYSQSFKQGVKQSLLYSIFSQFTAITSLVASFLEIAADFFWNRSIPIRVLSSNKIFRTLYRHPFSPNILYFEPFHCFSLPASAFFWNSQLSKFLTWNHSIPIRVLSIQKMMRIPPYTYIHLQHTRFSANLKHLYVSSSSSSSSSSR